MVDEPLWHIGQTASLKWAYLSETSDVTTVFHSGNGQTFAVDPLGLALLKTLEKGPLPQSRIFEVFTEQSLLPRDQEGLQRLNQALRQLHSSAIISRSWRNETQGVA